MESGFQAHRLSVWMLNVCSITSSTCTVLLVTCNTYATCAGE
jgi:hypothetical protein